MDFAKVRSRLILGIFLIWIVLWVNFILRDLLKKGDLRDYLALVKKSGDRKRAYVYGENFYDFLIFAKKHIPPGKSYKLEGPGNLSLMARRAVYYLYPLVESDKPDYILVFDEEKGQFGILNPKTRRFIRFKQKTL